MVKFVRFVLIVVCRFWVVWGFSCCFSLLRKGLEVNSIRLV